MGESLTRGIAMPALLYGTAWKKAQTAALVRRALELGFRGIDTACQPRHYEEAAVGEGVAAALGAGLRREDLYLQSKFTPLAGQDPARLPYDSQAPLAEQIAQSFAASCRNLRTAYLDALVLHSPLATARETLEAWRALESLAQAGGVRRLGISNCYRLGDLETLHRAAHIKPSIVQNRFYADTGYDRSIRAFCRAQGLTYQSFWTLSANAGLLASATLGELASRYGRTPAQILFRHLTQQHIVPLTGTCSEAHMREDLAIFAFELSASECAALDALC
ncbi:MAG TPA: aldo/keto reductase [Steroidobacteraceae bacterium]|nr:aldo/keto reductase [Steroidobacteraceae bacterium]